MGNVRQPGLLVGAELLLLHVGDLLLFLPLDRNHLRGRTLVLLRVLTIELPAAIQRLLSNLQPSVHVVAVLLGLGLQISKRLAFVLTPKPVQGAQVVALHREPFGGTEVSPLKDALPVVHFLLLRELQKGPLLRLQLRVRDLLRIQRLRPLAYPGFCRPSRFGRSVRFRRRWCGGLNQAFAMLDGSGVGLLKLGQTRDLNAISRWSDAPLLGSLGQRGITARRHFRDLGSLRLDSRHARAHAGVDLIDLRRGELHAFQQQALFL
ncbi:hypothetical protein D3C84_122030 [compost metagenome]